MVQLPTELWFHIASYLSPADLQSAFFIHPVLLELYLNHKYKSTVVSAPETKCNLYPEIAGKIRQLVFSDDIPTRVRKPTEVLQLPKGKRSLIKRWIRRVLRIVETRVTVHVPSVQELESSHLAKLIDCIPLLENVHSVHLALSAPKKGIHPGYFPMKMTFLNAWTERWADNLTHLSFDCSLLILPTHWPRYTRFRNLASLFVPLFVTSEQEAMLIDFLHPFIIAHSGSLTTFGIVEKPSWSRRSISALLDKEIVLPKLEKLIIGKTLTGFFDSDAQLIRRFMSKCSPALKELNCSLFHQAGIQSPGDSVYGNIHSNSILDYDFPCLEALTLSSHIPIFNAPDNRTAIEYAKRPRSQLRSLTLKTMVISRAAVEGQLFTPTALSTVFSNLARLSFSVQCLDVALLVFLATSLPRLEYLSIRLYRDVRGPACTEGPRNPTTSRQLDTTEFCSTLASLDPTTLTVFAAWRVRALDLVPFFCNTRLDPLARKTLVAALPDVYTFCDLDREEYATATCDPGEEWSRKLNYFELK